MKILAMDFDGVIVDSMNEGLFNGFSAYAHFHPDTKLFGCDNFEFKTFNKTIKKYKTQYEKFRKLRCYLRTALDYYNFILAIEKNAKIRNSADLAKFSEKSNMSYEKYTKIFYKNRLEYMKEFEKWVKLTPMFPHMLKILKERNLDSVFISTSNRKSTVLGIFNYYKIKFNSNNILDNGTSLDKKDHIKIIKKRKNVASNKIYFVDDQVSILLEMKKLGLNCFLAKWGYNNQEQRRKAERNGIKIVDKNEFVTGIL